MGEGWKKQEEQRRKRFFSLCVFPSFVGNDTKDDGRGGIWEKFFGGMRIWRGGRGLLEVFLESDEEITKVCCFFVACWKRNIFLEDDFAVRIILELGTTVIGADIESDIPLFCVEEFFFCVDVNSSIQINAKAAYFEE